MKKILSVFVIMLFAGGALQAQSSFTVAYSMGFGTGDLGDFVSQASFRGANIEFRKMVQPNIGIGLTFGWNVFYEELTRESYTVGTSTLTGKQFRYSNNFPMLLGANYYFSPGEKFNPFVGLGVGTIYTRRNTDMNLYTMEQEAWNFALAPEVGFLYNLTDGAAINVSGRYNHGFKAGNELDSDQSYFTLNVGFSFLNN
ncbi:MAG TPA: OmpW family outer membrane protein [Chryseolinea sp.]|nr:OmpW family outer membrane protein [Chryseolinea sp.]